MKNGGPWTAIAARAGAHPARRRTVRSFCRFEGSAGFQCSEPRRPVELGDDSLIAHVRPETRTANAATAPRQSSSAPPASVWSSSGGFRSIPNCTAQGSSAPVVSA
jgi:hypothetical protein